MADDVDAALREALAALSRDPRVRYAEVRFTDETVESVKIRASAGGEPLPHVATSRSRGVGIRVLGAKTWGFACTPRVDATSLRAAAERAAAIAEASSRVTARAVALPAREPQRGSWRTAVGVDPFAIAQDERLATITRPVLAMLGGDVRSAEGHLDFRRIDKRLLTTDGVDVTQTFVEGACNMQAIASGDGALPATRSYPTWTGCDAFQGGWERIRELALDDAAPRVKDEACALLRAPQCPGGETDVILESSQVALQVHESCGHPTELDRTMGTEITLAGGSFLDAGKLGTFRYGSDAVTITAGSTAPGGCGSFGWDDEGTPAGEHVLVDRGRLADFLSSRETAAAIGRASTGTMRASGWDRTPLIRMTNVSLAPGAAGSLDDLVADTKRGLLVATDRSWSIDDQRLDFQFSCELAWEIVNGKRTRLLRSPLYAGSTPSFWASCDAVCGPAEHRLWGVSSCGKGDPIQVISVGHGASPARFRRVRVGSAS
jgi:TldD protein